MQTKQFPSKFSSDRHTLYVGGMTGEPVWSCSVCFSSSGSWSPPQDQAALQETIKHHRLCYRSHDGSQSKCDCIQTGQGSSTAPWAPVWFLLQPQLFISVLLPLLSLVTWAGGRSSRVWAFLKLFGKSYWEGSLKLLEIMALLFQENYKSCVPQSQRKVTKWPRHKTQFWVSSALGTARS